MEFAVLCLNFFEPCWCKLLRSVCAYSFRCCAPVLQAHIDIAFYVALGGRVHMCCISFAMRPCCLCSSPSCRARPVIGILSRRVCVAPSITHWDFLRCHCQNCGSSPLSFSLSVTQPFLPWLLHLCCGRLPAHGINATA